MVGPVPALALVLALAGFSNAQLTPSPTYSPPSATQGTVGSTASPNPQWAAVLGNGLWFYDAQRSGNLSQGAYGNRVEWRNDSAMNDGQAEGLDLSGGWYDAGDYIKHIFPLGYTLFALSWGALSYGPGFEAARQTPYLDSTLRWGYDWMMKAHPSEDVLYVQFGSSEIDNGYWGGDENIPEPRPAYQVNSSAPGTDAWASTSAAFALGALAYAGQTWNTSDSAYSPAPLSNSAYSKQLLDHAVSLYKAATSSDQQSFTESAPGAADAYASSGFGDDLCTAALALAAATNESNYYADAISHYTTYKLSGSRAVWNWDSRTPAAFVLFAEIAVARPSLAIGAGLDPNVTGWQAEAESYFDAIINNQVKGAYLTNGGLLYYDGDSDEASLNPAMAAATLMLRYAPLATADKRDSYRNFALAQLDYVMGKNPANAVYMVGIHPNSPQNPHSGLATAGNGDDLENIRTSPEKEPYVLYGAVVGGPRPNDLFWDWRDDWVQTEIALDYNANVPALAAYQLANNASDPYYVQVQPGTYSIPSGQPCDAALQCKGGLSGGAIAGIVIGVVAAVCILAALAWWKRDWFRGRR